YLMNHKRRQTTERYEYNHDSYHNLPLLFFKDQIVTYHDYYKYLLNVKQLKVLYFDLRSQMFLLENCNEYINPSFAKNNVINKINKFKDEALDSNNVGE